MLAGARDEIALTSDGAALVTDADTPDNAGMFSVVSSHDEAGTEAAGEAGAGSTTDSTAGVCLILTALCKQHI